MLVEVPLEANRSGRRPAKRAEAAGSATSRPSTARRSRLAAGAGLRVAAELSDPLPHAHHAFFAASRPARGAARRQGGVRRGALARRARGAERLFTVHYACLARRR